MEHLLWARHHTKGIALVLYVHPQSILPLLYFREEETIAKEGYYVHDQTASKEN
jgi:hypothetical protein